MDSVGNAPPEGPSEIDPQLLQEIESLVRNHGGVFFGGRCKVQEALDAVQTLPSHQDTTDTAAKTLYLRIEETLPGDVPSQSYSNRKMNLLAEVSASMAQQMLQQSCAQQPSNWCKATKQIDLEVLDLENLQVNTAKNRFSDETVELLKAYRRALVAIQTPNLESDGKQSMFGSIFRRLCLHFDGRAENDQAALSLLQDVEFISLFSQVDITGCTIYPEKLEGRRAVPLKGDESSPHVDETVVDCLCTLARNHGVRSIRIGHCALTYSDILGLANAKGLEYLHLSDMHVFNVPNDLAFPQPCQKHNEGVPSTKVFICTPLQLPLRLQGWWRLLCDLPRVDSLDIYDRFLDHSGDIVQMFPMWDVSHFQLDCRRWIIDSLPILRDLLQAVARSPHLRSFQFVAAAEWPDDLTYKIPHLFLELALSPNTALQTLEASFEGEIEGYYKLILPLVRVSDLPNYSGVRGDDPDAKFSQLRKYRILPVFLTFLGDNGETQFVYEAYQGPALDESPLDNLRDILRLVTDYLPYVYDLGPGVQYLKEDSHWARPNATVDVTLPVRRKIMERLEQNRVGLTLFHPTVLSHVPRGLWSVVLAKSVRPNEEGTWNSDDIPWNSVFEMVRVLFQHDLVCGSSRLDEGRLQRRPNKRPKTN